MLNLPYYNIDKEYQYSYMLHILVRTLWLAWKCKITKKDFLLACKENGIVRRTAYRIWKDWAYKNKFIKFVSKDKNYLYITAKSKFELIIEKVPASIYNNIKTITDLKDFLHTSRLGRAWIKNKYVKTWKWLTKIASETNSSIATVSNRNKRSKEKFSLWIQKRYWVYNWMLIRLTNVYDSAIRVIRNKYFAVNCTIKNSRKAIDNDHFATLFKSMNTKITTKLKFANSWDYELINKGLYPKIS